MAHRKASAAVAASIALVGATNSARADGSEPVLVNEAADLDAALSAAERHRLAAEAFRLAPSVSPSEIEAFLSADRNEQSSILRAAGLTDPGGRLSDRAVQQYLLGQWFYLSGRSAEGAQLQLLSGLGPVDEAVAAARSLDLADFEPTDPQIEDTILGTGLGHDEALQRARLQNIAHHLRPLLSRMDEGYLELWVEADHRLVYSSADPHTADEFVRSLHLAPVIEVRASRFSEAELAGRAQRLVSIISEHSGHDDWTLRIDPIHEVIRLDYSEHDSQLSYLLASEEDVLELIAEESLTVHPISPDMLPRYQVALQGGRAGTGCTWAFSVRTTSDSERMLTASHCDDTQSQQGYNLPFVQACQGTMIPGCSNPESDAQEHNADNAIHLAFAQVFVQGGSARDITSTTTWTQMGVGDLVCHQGRTTGYTCGAIHSKFISQGITPGSDQFVQVRGDYFYSLGGDSGGPYIWGNSAFGIHSTGNNAAPPNGLGNFGAINFAEANLGVTVKTK